MVDGGPWNLRQVLLVGDAAHAMTPFLGQGMNCGLEDCVQLLACIDRSQGDFQAAFTTFERVRRTDAAAIARLSDMSFEEMIAHTRGYYQRKQREAWLARRFGDQFMPVYSFIAFGRLPYAKILHLKALQDKLLSGLQHHGIGLSDEDASDELVRPHLDRYLVAAQHLLGV